MLVPLFALACWTLYTVLLIRFLHSQLGSSCPLSTVDLLRPNKAIVSDPRWLLHSTSRLETRLIVDNHCLYFLHIAPSVESFRHISCFSDTSQYRSSSLAYLCLLDKTVFDWLIDLRTEAIPANGDRNEVLTQIAMEYKLVRKRGHPEGKPKRHLTTLGRIENEKLKLRENVTAESQSSGWSWIPAGDRWLLSNGDDRRSIMFDVRPEVGDDAARNSVVVAVRSAHLFDGVPTAVWFNLHGFSFSFSSYSKFKN